jgi:hypothetical protein
VNNQQPLIITAPQAAHIGVGISGREGRAAVQAADFAFGQFRWGEVPDQVGG